MDFCTPSPPVVPPEDGAGGGEADVLDSPLPFVSGQGAGGRGRAHTDAATLV